MNYKYFYFTLVLAVSLNLSADPLTKADRSFALIHLKKTKKVLIKTVKGLSDSQLNFRPSANSWSIAECLEHIAISENFIFALVDVALNGEVEKAELAMTDETLVKALADRTTKLQTLQPLEPTNSFGSPGDALKAFVERRNEHINYVKNTRAELRNSYYDFPFGKGDAYQVILFVGSHSERHTMQIKEIMEHVNFPN